MRVYELSIGEREPSWRPAHCDISVGSSQPNGRGERISRRGPVLDYRDLHALPDDGSRALVVLERTLDSFKVNGSHAVTVRLFASE